MEKAFHGGEGSLGYRDYRMCRPRLETDFWSFALTRPTGIGMNGVIPAVDNGGDISRFSMYTNVMKLQRSRVSVSTVGERGGVNLYEQT